MHAYTRAVPGGYISSSGVDVYLHTYMYIYVYTFVYLPICIYCPKCIHIHAQGMRIGFRCQVCMHIHVKIFKYAYKYCRFMHMYTCIVSGAIYFDFRCFDFRSIYMHVYISTCLNVYIQFSYTHKDTGFFPPRLPCGSKENMNAMYICTYTYMYINMYMQECNR